MVVDEGKIVHLVSLIVINDDFFLSKFINVFPYLLVFFRTNIFTCF